jgi:hypothetical protein
VKKKNEGNTDTHPKPSHDHRQQQTHEVPPEGLGLGAEGVCVSESQLFSFFRPVEGKEKIIKEKIQSDTRNPTLETRDAGCAGVSARVSEDEDTPRPRSRL